MEKPPGEFPRTTCPYRDEFVERENSISVSVRASRRLPGIWLSEPHRTSIILPMERHNWPAPCTRFIVYTQLARAYLASHGTVSPDVSPTFLLYFSLSFQILSAFFPFFSASLFAFSFFFFIIPRYRIASCYEIAKRASSRLRAGVICD